MTAQEIEVIGLERRLFTLEEYERMIEAAVFHEDEHIELIEGEIVRMAPIGFDHGMAVARLTRLLVRLVGDNAVVWVQSAIQLAPNSRPEPNLALLKWRNDYGAKRPPTGADVLLIVEVADTSLKYDRRVKGRLYAEAGVPEYWILNLAGGMLEIHTDPVEGAYKSARQAKRNEMLSLPGMPEGVVEVSEIMGPVVNANRQS
jgi:Uma2 family endonuclease